MRDGSTCVCSGSTGSDFLRFFKKCQSCPPPPRMATVLVWRSSKTRAIEWQVFTRLVRHPHQNRSPSNFWQSFCRNSAPTITSWTYPRLVELFCPTENIFAFLFFFQGSFGMDCLIMWFCAACGLCQEAQVSHVLPLLDPDLCFRLLQSVSLLLKWWQQWDQCNGNWFACEIHKKFIGALGVRAVHAATEWCQGTYNRSTWSRPIRTRLFRIEGRSTGCSTVKTNKIPFHQNSDRDVCWLIFFFFTQEVQGGGGAQAQEMAREWKLSTAADFIGRDFNPLGNPSDCGSNARTSVEPSFLDLSSKHMRHASDHQLITNVLVPCSSVCQTYIPFAQNSAQNKRCVLHTGSEFP